MKNTWEIQFIFLAILEASKIHFLKTPQNL